MNSPRVPGPAYAALAGGIAVNLCLGVLYAWSVWKAKLSPAGVPAGTPLTGLDAGWRTLSDSQSTWAYATCGITFAIAMLPAGRLQDRVGPRAATLFAGLFLAAGCVIAGLAKSYAGLVIGFGLFGGVGLGFGYAAATPAAARWFGPARRGLVVGLVVAGFGGASLYIAPAADWLITTQGLTGSFVALGLYFGLVVLAAGRFLRLPPPNYVPPAAPVHATNRGTAADVPTRVLLRRPLAYVLILLFAGSAQGGLILIANATPILKAASQGTPFLVANAWLLAAFGGLINALGRVGTGLYSDSLGRLPAYVLNGTLAVVALALMPQVVASRSPELLFLVVGVAFWQYGGTLSLMPSLTADLFGTRHLGANYGVVFLGWGLAFLGPQLAAELKASTARADLPYYASAAILATSVVGAALLSWRQRKLKSQ